jgi:hypothetical protein
MAQRYEAAPAAETAPEVLPLLGNNSGEKTADGKRRGKEMDHMVLKHNA